MIQRELQDPLAEMILAGEVPDGATVKITGGTDKLLFLPRVAGGKGQGGGGVAVAGTVVRGRHRRALKVDCQTFPWESSPDGYFLPSSSASPMRSPSGPRM